MSEYLQATLEDLNELFVVIFGIKMDEYIYKEHKALRYTYKQLDPFYDIEVIFYDDNGILKTNQKLDFQLLFEELVKYNDFFLTDMYMYFQFSIDPKYKDIVNTFLDCGIHFIKDYVKTIDEFFKKIEVTS